MSDDFIDKLTNHPFLKDGKMNELLDLNPVEVKQYLVKMREDRNDLETVREELHDIMSCLKTSMKQQMQEAAQVSLPRAHEVIATTAEKRIHAAQALQELTETMNTEPGDNAKVINNTLHISSSDMLDMIKDKLVGPDEDAD